MGRQVNGIVEPARQLPVLWTVVLEIQITTGLLNSDMLVLVPVRTGQNSRDPIETPLEIADYVFCRQVVVCSEMDICYQNRRKIPFQGSVLWINADPEPVFFISIRIRIQETRPIRIRIRSLVRLKSHKMLNFFIKNILLNVVNRSKNIPGKVQKALFKGWKPGLFVNFG